MPQPHIRPDLYPVPIERRHCPKCQGRMMARIEFGHDGADLLTFECARCNQTLHVALEDPLKSDKAAGWQNGELKPPR